MRHLTKETFIPSTASEASINIGEGAAVTAPVSGDIWNEGGALKLKTSTVTKTVATVDQIGGMITEVKTTHFEAVGNRRYVCNTSGNVFNCSLPAGVTGEAIELIDLDGTWETNNLTVIPNGSEKINGVAENLVCDLANAKVTLTYCDSTRGWQLDIGGPFVGTGSPLTVNNITPVNGNIDFTADDIPYTPTGNITADTVANAIGELDNEKVSAAAPVFTGIPSETMPADLGSGSGTRQINLSTGSIFTATATGACAWNFTNAPAGAWSATLMLTYGGAGTQTWQVGGSAKTIKTIGGAVLTYSGSGLLDIIEIFSPDGGTTLYIWTPAKNWANGS